MWWLATLGVVLGLLGSASPALAWQDWPGEWRPGRPSQAVVAVERPTARPERIELPAFRLAVPFRTQNDGGRWQTSNCGPAILGMVLDGFGVMGQATDDLRFRSHSYQGAVGMRSGTALQHIVRVAEDLGITTVGLYEEGDRFRSWSMDDIRDQLRQGRPVMSLVRLYLMPGYEGIGARWGHYVLVTGIAEDGGFFYSDPLQTDPAFGTTRVVSPAQLERAMSQALVPGQAVAFGSPSTPPLEMWTP